MEAQSTTATVDQSAEARFADMARAMWSTGDFARVAARLSELRTEHRTIESGAGSAAELVQFHRTWFGPTRTAFARLDETGQATLAADLAAAAERFNRATDGTLVAEAECLEVVAVKA